MALKTTLCGKKTLTPNRRAKMVKVKTKMCMTTSCPRNGGEACSEKVMVFSERVMKKNEFEGF